MPFSTPTVITTFSPGRNGGSSASGLDTTPYNLIIIFTSTFSTESSPPIVSDNHQTYTQGDTIISPGGTVATMYYKYNPITDTNAQFSISRNDSYSSVIVVGCTGALTSSDPYDQHNSTSTSSESS